MDKEKEYSNYYAIIPANVRYDNRLNADEKLLYGEITAMLNKDGECCELNSYFAELYSVSNKMISICIKNLVNYGYLKIEIVRNEKAEFIRRNIMVKTH